MVVHADRMKKCEGIERQAWVYRRNRGPLDSTDGTGDPTQEVEPQTPQATSVQENEENATREATSPTTNTSENQEDETHETDTITMPHQRRYNLRKRGKQSHC